MRAVLGVSLLRAVGGLLASALLAAIPLLVVFSFSAETWVRWVALAACAYIFAVMMRVTYAFTSRAVRDTQTGDPDT